MVLREHKESTRNLLTPRLLNTFREHMRFYETPLKNPSAASLSLLLGMVVIAATALSLRISNAEQLAQNAEPITTTIPIDPFLSEMQKLIQNDREQKLTSHTLAQQKTITETKPIRTTTTVTGPKETTTAKTTSTVPTSKKADRTTKTS